MAKDRICSIPECGKPVLARGWCSTHWKRWRKYGDPLTKKSASNGDLLEWVTSAADSKEDGCIIWPFGSNGNGYGRLRYDGKYEYAHRIVCRIAHGDPSPQSPNALHRCGNGSKGCVNPQHLYWGDQKQNRADCVAHGRANTGSRNGASKLSAEAVQSIRTELALGRSTADLGKQFGVCQQTVSDISTGKTWRHLPSVAE